MICSVCGADVTADFGSDVSTGVTCRHIACAAHVTPRVDHPVLGVVCACPASGCKGLHAPFTIPPGPDDTCGQAAAVGEVRRIMVDAGLRAPALAVTQVRRPHTGRACG